MKKSVKWILSLAVVLVLAGLWTWRFIEVNRFYYDLEANDGTGKEYYELGDTVVFGDNQVAGVSADGYAIHVNSLEYIDYAPYTTVDSFKNDKMILVHTTVSRVAKGKSKGLNLFDMELYGKDCYFEPEYNGIGIFNPDLEKNAGGITLPVGTSYDVTLAYHACKSDFNRRTWEHLDEHELYFSTTGYFPTCKVIKVQ